MKQGEVSKLTITADYGYGESGSPPKIPGGATLVGAASAWPWLAAWARGRHAMLGASTRRHSRPGGVQGRDCPAAKHTLSPCLLPQVFEVELIDWKSVKDIAGGLVTLHPAE